MAFDKGMIPYIPADQEKVPEKKGPEQSNVMRGANPGQTFSNTLVR